MKDFYQLWQSLAIIHLIFKWIIGKMGLEPMKTRSTAERNSHYTTSRNIYRLEGIRTPDRLGVNEILSH